MDGCGKRSSVCGGLKSDGRNGTAHKTGKHECLQPQHMDGMLQLRDGLFRCVHGNEGRRSQTVTVLAINVRVEVIERSAGCASQFFILEMGNGQAKGGI